MPAPAASRLTLETIGGVTVVAFNDSEIVDDYTLNAVRDELFKLVDEKKLTRIVLNLGKIRKYSTQFLGNLLGLKARLMKAGGAMKLCGIAPNLMDAVRILRIEREFDIFPEEQSAVDAFRK
jgi:anti-anti-sigma factor